ncbi:uncharacterized protein [Nicotiana sylvestris]|uniref:uncharacterized protein n=1 Tax=Nicotiana sylvestris TaxID=4096 RepID=UPI00388CCB5E
MGAYLDDSLEKALMLFGNIDLDDEVKKMVDHMDACAYIKEMINFEPLDRPTEPPPKPSIEEDPKLELKPLPFHLHYAYLGSNEILPVVYLLGCLFCKRKNCFACLESTRGRLYGPWLTFMVLALHFVCINSHGGWAKTKCGTPMPLESSHEGSDSLAVQDYYCFLDGYSGYNQILIVPKDQEKTPSLVLMALTLSRECHLGCAIHVRLFKVLMDDFLVFGPSVDELLTNLSKVPARLLEKNTPFKFDELCLKAYEELKRDC